MASKLHGREKQRRSNAAAHPAVIVVMRSIVIMPLVYHINAK
jgi:hypothetical protein